LPKAENVVFTSVDAIDVVIIFCLQLLSDSHNRLDTFLIGKNVRLDGLVFLGGSFDSGQVESKVVLIEEISAL
jgi:hypothetical protein